MITLTNPPTTEWLTVEVGDQSVRIELMLPDYGALITDRVRLCQVVLERVTLAAFESERVAATVANWEGVVDEAGEDIEFTLDGFKQLCRAYPKVLKEVLARVRQLFDVPGK